MATSWASVSDACWKEVSWSDLSPRYILRICPDLVVLVGSARRIQQADLPRESAPGYRTLAVLPDDSSTEDLDLAQTFADDLILASERRDMVGLRVRHLLQNAGNEADRTEEALVAELGRANLVGRDPRFLRSANRIEPCARADLPVLITGETGTGKEMFARAIHFISGRRNHPFVPVDCGSIPDHLFENELFGHVRGAYTDARGDQRGLAAVAEGGTLFLDEVESLSPAGQTKLLRFLQERQFRALGSEKWSHSDVRIVAATNRDLARQTAEKQFREDLYFRLDVLRLDVPPLRERPLDIPLLAQSFLSRYQPPGQPRMFSPSALRRLTSYHWPGNVRELLNVIQRAIVFARGPQIDACDIVLTQTQPADAKQDYRTAREETMERFEREYVRELLQRHHGNVTHAAREAKKERRAFGRLVKKYGFRAQAGAAGQF